MTILRIVVGILAVIGVAAVLASVIRTVVLPRGVPARLARVVFLVVRNLLTLRLRFAPRRQEYRTRDRIFALQAPLGLFAQLFAWVVLVLICFAALFWALSDPHHGVRDISAAIEQAGSAVFTLGFDTPHGLIGQLVAFSAAGVGLSLFALVITYLPSVYGAFSRREALITKLVVRTDTPPDGAKLLIRSWELDRFRELDDVWNDWEDWFIDVGETHTSFPQLGFFRSPHPRNHWVLAAEAVLDGSALLNTVCDVEREYRSELCLRAGVSALTAIADFLGIPHRPPEGEDDVAIEEKVFRDGYDRLAQAGVPLHEDADSAWAEFRRVRGRYEPLLAVLGRMTDAPRSDWSSWSDGGPRHSPPLIRIHNTGRFVASKTPPARSAPQPARRNLHPVDELQIRERPPADQAAGMLILHHGRGADEHDLISLADVLDPEQRLHVVAPRAPLTLPGWPGYHWYRVPEVGYPEPESFAVSFAQLAALHDRLWERTGIAPERTVLGGFSMGCVMSYALGLGPGRPVPAGILAFSGFIPTVQRWEPDLAPRAGLPVFISHGRRDPVIGIQFAHRARQTLESAGLTVDYHEYQGGHQIEPDAARAAIAWLGGVL